MLLFGITAHYYLLCNEVKYIPRTKRGCDLCSHLYHINQQIHQVPMGSLWVGKLPTFASALELALN